MSFTANLAAPIELSNCGENWQAVAASRRYAAEMRESANCKRCIFCPNCVVRGVEWELAQRSLTFAREQSFRQCYLETTATLDRAIALYEQLCFCHIPALIGNTAMLIVKSTY